MNQKKGNVKISESEIIRKQITSFDVTEEGDLRPYTYEEIKKIKEYLYKENNLKSYLVGSIIVILTQSSMRPATVCSLTYKCIQNINNEGYAVYASSKRNTNNKYHVDKRTGKKLRIDKLINKRNKEHKTILNDFIYYKTNKITELTRENKLLKGHDAEHMLLKTEYEQLQKQYKDSIIEIKRLRGLVIKYQNANKRNSSTSLN